MCGRSLTSMLLRCPRISTLIVAPLASDIYSDSLIVLLLALYLYFNPCVAFGLYVLAVVCCYAVTIWRQVTAITIRCRGGSSSSHVWPTWQQERNLQKKQKGNRIEICWHRHHDKNQQHRRRSSLPSDLCDQRCYSWWGLAIHEMGSAFPTTRSCGKRSRWSCNCSWLGGSSSSCGSGPRVDSNRQWVPYMVMEVISSEEPNMLSTVSHIWDMWIWFSKPKKKWVHLISGLIFLL